MLLRQQCLKSCWGDMVKEAQEKGIRIVPRLAKVSRWPALYHQATGGIQDAVAQSPCGEDTTR